MSIMDRRVNLQNSLEVLLGSGNVYFQPPDNVTLSYPAIVYKLDDMETRHANDLPYTINVRYQLTYIDRRPNSPVLEKLVRLRSCSFDRAFTSEGLNHAIYNLYY